jgi:hypothetical protein
VEDDPMSIKDMLSLADDKLHEVFSRKPFDPTKHRKALQKRLQASHDQYTSATPVKGRKLFTIGSEGIVRFNSPIELNGKSEFYFENGGKFQEFLAHFTQLVGAGEFDGELEKKAMHPGATSTAPGATSTAPSANEMKKERAGWSDERRAKFLATQAAKAAKKPTAKAK